MSNNSFSEKHRHTLTLSQTKSRSHISNRTGRSWWACANTKTSEGMYQIKGKQKVFFPTPCWPTGLERVNEAVAALLVISCHENQAGSVLSLELRYASWRQANAYSISCILQQLSPYFLLVLAENVLRGIHDLSQQGVKKERPKCDDDHVNNGYFCLGCRIGNTASFLSLLTKMGK